VRLLEQFFYWVELTERYSLGTESKLSEDFNKMDLLSQGYYAQLSEYRDDHRR